MCDLLLNMCDLLLNMCDLLLNMCDMYDTITDINIVDISFDTPRELISEHLLLGMRLVHLLLRIISLLHTSIATIPSSLKVSLSLELAFSVVVGCYYM